MGRHINQSFRLLLVALFVMMTGCDRAEENVKLQPLGSSTRLEVVNITPISALKIDELEFKPDMTVGFQTFTTSQAPVVNLVVDPEVDYVDLVRCNSNELFTNGRDALEDIALQRSSDLEEQILRETNFFEEASNRSGCEKVGSEYNNQAIVFDATAPSGEFRYLARACFDPSRLQDNETIGTRNCSKQVSVSRSVRYTNTRAQAERLAYKAVNDQKAKIDTLGQQIYYNTVSLNNSVASCQKKTNRQLLDQQRVQAITGILSGGVGWAQQLYGQVGPTNGLAPASAEPVVQDIEQVWQTVAPAVSASTAADLSIGASIADFLTRPWHYPESCTGARKHEQLASVMAGELKSAHTEYNQRVSQMQGISGANSQLETPQ